MIGLIIILVYLVTGFFIFSIIEDTPGSDDSFPVLFACLILWPLILLYTLGRYIRLLTGFRML